MTRLGIFGLIVAVPFAALAGLVGYGVYLEREVTYWNNKIDELCAEDGGKNVGLRVYERVMAPESYIRPASGAMPGSVHVPGRYPGSLVKEDEPIVEEMVEIQRIRSSKPIVYKYAIRITRVRDEKVLAEEIKYIRTGGGIPTPGPSEVYSCPNSEQSRVGTSAIYNEVFINHPLNDSQE